MSVLERIILWEEIQGRFIFIVGMEKEKQQREWDYVPALLDLGTVF